MGMLNRDAIVSKLNSDRYVQGLILGECMNSTNAKLKDMALHRAAEGCTIIAGTQTDGRGRRGRSFCSPEGGLYLSTLLRPQAPFDAGRVTCCAAVAAARAIESLCALSVDVKWVNDLFIRGRKVGGILAEGVIAPDGILSAVVLGIGINLHGVLSPELTPIATTLSDEGAEVEREALAAAFLNEWERLYTATDSAEWMMEYRRRSLVIGKTVTVLRGESCFEAVAQAVTDEGHLVVRTADGVMELSSGEVSVRL